MRIKVCGMKSVEVARELAHEPRITHLGAIFWEGSSRYVSPEEALFLREAAPDKKWVGVFVDHDIKGIATAVDLLSLAVVQLHGEESPDDVTELREALPVSVEIWKAIRIADGSELETIPRYGDAVRRFLLDTKSDQLPGGTGKKFSWSLLDETRIGRSFIVSGGVQPSDGRSIRELAAENPNMYGVDLNSRFESAPGVKDFGLIQQFLDGVEP